MTAMQKQIAFILIGLMLFGGPLASLVPNNLTLSPLEESQSSGGSGTEVLVDILPGSPSATPYTLTLPNQETAITSLNLSIAPKASTTSQSFVWDDSFDWNHPDATNQNTYTAVDALTSDPTNSLSWDFDNSLQGWTLNPSGSSSGNNAHNTMACGRNGSSGKSIELSGPGQSNVISPQFDLSGLASATLTAWVQEGTYNCGEPPDNGENLLLQYKNPAGNWVTHHTFPNNALSSNIPAINYATSLPSAAIHQNSQIRFQLTQASINGDNYYFDDVRIVTPPAGNWLSPTFGHSNSATFKLANGPYEPMIMDVDYLSDDTWLNWTLVDAQSGLNISGFESISSERIHLDALDHAMYPKLRLLLEFRSTFGDPLPLLNSISAGGLNLESFDSHSESRGWGLTNATLPLDLLEVGRGYTPQSNVPTITNEDGTGMTLNITASPLTVGITETVSISSVGWGYVGNSSVQPTGGSGTGLSLSFAASSILSGVVATQTLTNSGTNYTSTVATTSGSSTGSGLRVSISATTITTGMVQSLAISDGGTNYSSDLGVSTFGIGGGSGLTLDITAASGTIVSAVVNSSGSNYGIGDLVWISGGDFDGEVNITGVSSEGGEITSVSINSAGQNYAAGDILTIDGGDGDARLTVTSVQQTGGNITSVSILNGGSNYLANDILSIPGGDNNAEVRIDSITKLGGNVTSFEIASAGQGYKIGDRITILVGDNDATLEVLDGMNGTNSEFISPWFLSNGPLTGIKVSAQQVGYDASMRTNTNMSWVPIALPFESFGLGHQDRVQIKFEHNGGQGEVLVNSQIRLHTGSMIQAPSLDIDGDEEMEWGGSDTRIGAWGYQNRFANGNASDVTSIDMNGVAKTSAWLPQNGLTSMAFGLSTQNGNLTGIGIRVGGMTVVSETFDSLTATRIHLNSTQKGDLITALNSQSGILYHNQVSYVQVEIEAYGTGNVTFSNLAVPHAASNYLVGGPTSRLVQTLNALTRSGSPPTITLPFAGESFGMLEITTNEYLYSNDVGLESVSVNSDSLTLTPSQRFVDFSAAFDVVDGRTVNLLRLDVEGELHKATWLIPTSGLNSIGQGRSDLVELHSNPLSITQSSSGAEVFTISFRMEQGWDDEQVLSVSLRCVLDNGVVSRPGTHTWGSENLQGYENDLAIKSVLFLDDRGQLGTDIDYLKAQEELDTRVSIGYQGVQSFDAFADGDAEVQLWREGTMIANTTSLDVEWWNVSDSTPLTVGDFTWTVKIIPLNGGDIIDESEYSRTFRIDPTAPSVIDASVEWYDHRLASTSQTIQFEILDPVLLPSDVHLMLWREWADDDDLNGWPSPDEYKQRSLIIPTDLTISTGLYTLLFDDSMGSQGQKVAGYLVGMDASGQILENAGTGEDGEHLFMYQIGPDGPPTLSSTAMSWTGGATPWLHPSQPYTLRIDMSEPNGASDLTTVEVQLASNILTSPLSFTWDFRTDSCTSGSIHLVINDCNMLSLDGFTAGPYEKDTRLVVELELAWTTPDLGDTFREPSVKIIDRAGQEVIQTFPALRWRFSPALTIPQDSVSLVLTQGTVLDDGARLPPNSPFELTGGLMFETSELVPSFNCTVDVAFAGQVYSAETYNGIWNVELQSPLFSDTIPLTWSVGCLPPQGVDATEEGSSVKWMVIDGLGPVPQEVQSPRPGSILSAEEHEVTIVLVEEGGIDFESLRLAWWVEDYDTGEFIRGGDSPFLLQGTDIRGLNLVGTGTMDLSVITDEMLIDRFVVYVVVEGRDLAGNLVLGGEGQSAGNAVTSWLMEWRQPKFEFETPAMEYSRLNLQTGDSTAVQIFVKNVGTLEGTTSATISVVRADGTSEVLRQTEVEILEGGLGTLLVDWAPEQPGSQWIVVELENGEKGVGPSVDVRTKTDPSFSEAVFGDVNPILGSIGALLGVSIVLALLLMARNATVRRGSKSEYEWDEYSDYVDEEEDEYLEQESDSHVEKSNDDITHAEPIPVEGGSTVSSSSTNGWKQGSDGVWWWQNPQDGSWWYKDANGEILQYK